MAVAAVFQQKLFSLGAYQLNKAERGDPSVWLEVTGRCVIKQEGRIFLFIQPFN